MTANQFYSEHEPRICSFTDNSAADKIARIKGCNIDAKLTRSIKAGEMERTARRERRIIGFRDFRRLAKSEIDCSAITIRCTQPGDGFRPNRCRRNICECIFPDISDGPHVAIRMAALGRIEAVPIWRGVSGTRYRDHYCRTHNAHYVIPREWFHKDAMMYSPEIMLRKYVSDNESLGDRLHDSDFILKKGRR